MSSKLEQLEKLKKLLDEGEFSKEEYEVLKQRFVRGNQNQETPIPSVLT